MRFRRPDYDPDRAQKLISSSMSRHLSTRNISSKFMQAFLSNLANRQTDRQTNTDKNTLSEIIIIAIGQEERRLNCGPRSLKALQSEAEFRINTESMVCDLSRPHKPSLQTIGSCSRYDARFADQCFHETRPITTTQTTLVLICHSCSRVAC